MRSSSGCATCCERARRLDRRCQRAESGQQSPCSDSELIGRRISVETELADSACNVGRPIQLRPVVLNLLMNAMDAMVSTPIAQQVRHGFHAGDARPIGRGAGEGPRDGRPADATEPSVPFDSTPARATASGFALTICSSHRAGARGRLQLDQ